MAQPSEEVKPSMSTCSSTNVSAIKAFIVGFLVAGLSFRAAIPAAASEWAAHIGWQVRQPTRFMVSGVLRQDETTGVFKPIHGNRQRSLNLIHPECASAGLKTSSVEVRTSSFTPRLLTADPPDSVIAMTNPS